MKSLPLTPQLKEMLKASLGDEVEVDDFVVFEAIALNDKPLPGKRGTIFHGAVVPPTTLLAMVNHINSGNSLPLMQDHNLEGEPFGRIFHAGLNYADTGVEFRALFYVDPTETKLIAKLNNGTYDEVSVQFLAKQILCSECGFDYRGEDSTFENLMSLTCNEGHIIGNDGVHARLIGLEIFTEVSLVARGAADKPKIIGRTNSKLAPALEQRLAAQGFTDLGSLVCRASIGETIVAEVDVNKLIADLADTRAKVATINGEVTTLTARATAAETARDDLQTKLTAAEGERDQAVADLAAAKAATRADEADAALAYLSDVLKNVRIASGKAEGELPKTVAELTAAIDEETSKLTAILPVGGKGKGATNDEDSEQVKPSYAAFKLAR